MKLHPRVLLHVKRGRWYWPPGCPSCTINSLKTSLCTYLATHRNCDNGGWPTRRRSPALPACKTGDMRITVLAGGVGAARFLRGLKAAAPDAQITVVGNTGDDITLFGLRVCPDLDTVMYTLGGGINPEQGWGRADESFTLRDELAAYGAGPSWFTLGDRDFATHIVRTQLLSTGTPLSEVTRVLCERWQPGVRLLPMTDDTVE